MGSDEGPSIPCLELTRKALSYPGFPTAQALCIVKAPASTHCKCNLDATVTLTKEGCPFATSLHPSGLRPVPEREMTMVYLESARQVPRSVLDPEDVSQILECRQYEYTSESQGQTNLWRRAEVQRQEEWPFQSIVYCDMVFRSTSLPRIAQLLRSLGQECLDPKQQLIGVPR